MKSKKATRPAREATSLILEAMRVAADATANDKEGRRRLEKRLTEINPLGWSRAQILRARRMDDERSIALLKRAEDALEEWGREVGGATDQRVLDAYRAYWASVMLAFGEELGLEVVWDRVSRLIPDSANFFGPVVGRTGLPAESLRLVVHSFVDMASGDELGEMYRAFTDVIARRHCDESASS